MKAPAWSTPRQIGQAIGDAGSGVDVVADPGVLELAPVRSLLDSLSERASVTVFEVDQLSLDDLGQMAGHSQGEVIVGLGGGRAIDAAKICRALRDGATPASSQRSGLRTVGSVSPDAPRLIAVPCTVGTGAEVSSGAVLTDQGRPVLVRGLCMIPEEAFYSAEIFASLPWELVMRGCVEVLFRILGPALESDSGRSVGEVLEWGHRVLRAAENVGSGGWPLAAVPTLLEAGAAAHGPDLHAGTYPFGSRVWYVSTEASHLLNRPKMTVLPALWLSAIRLSADGRLDWIDPGCQARAHRELALDRYGESLPAALEALFERWGVVTHLDVPDRLLDTIADRSLWRWGSGLPMLRNAGQLDVVALLQGSAPEALELTRTGVSEGGCC